LMKQLGKKRLILELTRPLAELPAALADHRLERSPDGMRLTHTYDAQRDESGIDRLLEELRGQGIAYRDLSTAQSSLEEIFVNLVGGDR
jgi:ABC-2 type transport system ATP-binding protein